MNSTTLESFSSFIIPDRVSFSELAPGYPCVNISNQNATAKIALHGAHVIDYTPKDQPPVIFTSEQAIYREGKAIRGGIPICWPWFSAHPSDSSLPSHGYARISFWSLFRTSSTDELTTLVFHYSKDNLHAELTVEIGDSLSLNLKTTNTGSQTATIGGALHSYFSVSNINYISIKGLETKAYHDSLTGKQETSTNIRTIGKEIDRVYTDTKDTVIIEDRGFNRDIVIGKSGSKSTVVWNPWIHKSATMADLGNDDYKHFVCVETANALKDVYQIAPGESHSLITKILVDSSKE